MKLILDSHYAPSIIWWAFLVQADEVWLEQQSFYRKGTFRNRCHIYGANGLLRLSIPLVKGKHQRSIIKNVQISNDHPWQKLHWDSLCTAYRSSPYFEFYEDDFEGLYTKEQNNLFDFNLELIRLIASLMGIQKPISLTSEYIGDYDNNWLDIREVIHPNQTQLSKNIQSEFEIYIQVFSSKLGFLENLSVFDLLFNLGPASLDYLQNKVKGGIILP